MKNISWFVCFVATLCLTVASCKSSSSLGSSKLLQDTTQSYAQAQYEDCLAWKFTLMATLNHMIWQKERDLLFDRKRRDDPDFMKNNSSYYKLIDMKKIFPAETASTILNTIIKKEGASCSEELLYDTPCVFHISPPRGGPMSNRRVIGEFDFDYLARAIGFSTKDYTIESFVVFFEKTYF